MKSSVCIGHHNVYPTKTRERKLFILFNNLTLSSIKWSPLGEMKAYSRKVADKTTDTSVKNIFEDTVVISRLFIS